MLRAAQAHTVFAPVQRDQASGIGDDTERYYRQKAPAYRTGAIWERPGESGLSGQVLYIYDPADAALLKDEELLDAEPSR